MVRMCQLCRRTRPGNRVTGYRVRDINTGNDNSQWWPSNSCRSCGPPTEQLDTASADCLHCGILSRIKSAHLSTKKRNPASFPLKDLPLVGSVGSGRRSSGQSRGRRPRCVVKPPSANPMRQMGRGLQCLAPSALPTADTKLSVGLRDTQSTAGRGCIEEGQRWTDGVAGPPPPSPAALLTACSSQS